MIDTRMPGLPAETTAIRLRLIGQMEAWTVGGESVLPPGRKTRALLAIVVLSSPRPVLRSRLAELLWSRRPEEQARASLRQEIHRLLEVLAPAGQEVLLINRDSLSLRPGVVWVDVDEVLRATTSHPGSLALLDSELLEELDGLDPAFDVWLHGERERLRDRARSVAEALLNEQVAPEALIPVAQQLLAIDRAHEGAWRALMRAHAERGERGMAIQSYDRCRAVLADLLDAVPSPETQALLAEIRSGKAVRPLSPPPAPVAEARQETRLTSRNGPRVGVIPLALVGTEEAENHLALGLAEEITSSLSRFRWMSLVSSSSTAQLTQDGRDDNVLRQALLLDYLLDGSVQRVARRLRVTLRLVDIDDGNKVVWTRRFDRQVDDLLSLQDEIAAEVAAQVDPEIMAIESRRAAQLSIHDATAYELMARALPSMTRLDRARFGEAGNLLRRAIELEPDYAPAHAWYAFWLQFLVENQWADDAAAGKEHASRHAERAITLDSQDGLGFAIAGHVRATLQLRVVEALSLHERALTLNPNLAMGWALSAFTYLYTGDSDEAQRRLERYKQLSPSDPFAFLYDVGFSLAAFMKGDYERAAALSRSVGELNPGFCAACKPFLAALGHLGQVREAGVIRQRLLALEPGFDVARFIESSPYVRQEDTEHFAEGLRRAGVPERVEARS